MSYCPVWHIVQSSRSPNLRSVMAAQVLKPEAMPSGCFDEGLNHLCTFYTAHDEACANDLLCLQAILMNKEDTTHVRLVFANTQEHDILLRCCSAGSCHPVNLQPGQKPTFDVCRVFVHAEEHRILLRFNLPGVCTHACMLSGRTPYVARICARFTSMTS